MKTVKPVQLSVEHDLNLIVEQIEDAEVRALVVDLIHAIAASEGNQRMKADRQRFSLASDSSDASDTDS